MANIQGSFEKKNGNIHKKHKVVIGASNCSNSGGFEAACPRIWLYVGRCRGDTNEEDIKTYIEKKIATENISVKKLQSKGNNSSFCVGIEGNLEEQLYDPTFWPKGIIIRRYKFFRLRNETNTEPQI